MLRLGHLAAIVVLLIIYVAAQSAPYRPSCLVGLDPAFNLVYNANAVKALCTVNATNPCNATSLPALISCLDAQCASNSALANFALKYAPKLEYSCQQSEVPGTHDDSPRLTITGLGQCASSPYDFRSFVADSGNENTISQLCRMKVYPKTDCVGDATTLKLDKPYEQCIFQGGRSARLDCAAAHDDSAAIRYARDLCSNVTDSTLNLSASQAGITSTAGFTGDGADLMSTASPSTIPNKSEGASPSGNISNITDGSQYLGTATTRSDASIAALLAVVAAIALL